MSDRLAKIAHRNMMPPVGEVASQDFLDIHWLLGNIKRLELARQRAVDKRASDLQDHEKDLADQQAKIDSLREQLPGQQALMATNLELNKQLAMCREQLEKADELAAELALYPLFKSVERNLAAYRETREPK